MNLNEKFELGGSIGNKTEEYNNMVIRIYKGNSSYTWYDYINDTEVTFVVTADGQELNIHGLNHVITIETAGKINSIQINSSEIHGTYDSIRNITRFVIE